MASSATVLSCCPTFSGTPPPHSSKTRTLHRRLTVSCNSQNEETPQQKIDRRNLLVGMGGMYGAANLVSPALADPISPDLESCERGQDLNRKEKLDVACCKKESKQPTPFKLKPVRFRPAAHLVTPEYIEKYERAVQLMKSLPKDDPRNFYQQANVHCAYCNYAYNLSGVNPKEKLQIHSSWNFFPWHRWYLYFYEGILGHLIDDPTFGLPFWNWDNKSPGPRIPSMYVKDVDSSLYNPRRNPKNLHALANLKISDKKVDTPEDERVNNNQEQMYSEMITNAAALEDFYGGNLYKTGKMKDTVTGTVESGSHTAVHIWVGQEFNKEENIAGEDMGNFYTAGKDPLFFAHHANIDRLWSVWRDRRGCSNLPKEFDDKDWLKSSYVFYDENKELVRVYVKDCLDHEKMGYTFQEVENPWVDFKPEAASTTVRREETPQPVNFPVILYKVVKLRVKRPAGGKRRDPQAKKREEEMLVIEGIKVDMSKPVRFEVYLNRYADNPDDLLDKAVYAGCFGQVPHKVPDKNGKEMKSTQIKLGLSKWLEILGIEEEPEIVVSLVPTYAGEDITIGGVKIVYVDYATGEVNCGTCT